ncbi:polyphenol oxidase family protein [Planctomycetota bacterium]
MNNETSSVMQWDVLPNGWLVGRFAVFSELGIPHIVTTRRGPNVNRVAEELDRLVPEITSALKLSGAAWLDQVHGGDVLTTEQEGRIGAADGLISATSGLALIGKSADCPLILVADPIHQAIGFAHASWRSTVAGVSTTLITRMRAQYASRPEQLIACICPSIGPECYAVGPEVRAAAERIIGPHARSFFLAGSQQEHLDLWAANTDALLRSGLMRHHVHVPRICTQCRNDLFPSYRKEGPLAGRFLAVLGLKSG